MAEGHPSSTPGSRSAASPRRHCKFFNYPPQFTVSGDYTPSGTITNTVPIKDVGSSPDTQLYSATGVMATQTESSSTGTAIFNVIDSTAPYDVQPK